jgi:hypothetical protein
VQVLHFLKRTKKLFRFLSVVAVPRQFSDEPGLAGDPPFSKNYVSPSLREVLFQQEPMRLAKHSHYLR